MSHSAANPAAMPNLCPFARRMPFPSRQARNGGWEEPSFSGAVAARIYPRSQRSSTAEDRTKDFGPVSELRPVSRPLLGVTLGASPAPGGTRSSASALPPLRGLGSSRNKFQKRGQVRRENFFQAPPRESRPSALGSRAHSPRFAVCDPSRIREIQRNGDQPHVPEQSHPHRIPRQGR